MTTKTMMQLAWDNWHADMAPDDIPGINPSFKEGWERCAELHAGIDLDKLNDDSIGYRDQIARLRMAVEALTKERDDFSYRYQTASKLVSSSLEALSKALTQRNALEAAARLALDSMTLISGELNDELQAGGKSPISWDATLKSLAAISALDAALL